MTTPASDTSCIFCAILRGEAPGSIVHEDGDVVVLMSLHQFNPGHVLVMPRRHVVNLYDLPDDLAGPIFATVARMARAIKQEFQADGVTVRQHNDVAGGQSVFHLHVHVAPRYYGDAGQHFPGEPTDQATLAALGGRLQRRLAGP